MAIAPPSLLQLIVAEAELIGTFITTLQIEQNDLNHGLTTNLPELAERKTALAEELTALAKQRHDFLAAQGFAAGRKGMESWCSAHPGERGIFEAWGKILQLADEARELHRLNGELISVRMQYNASALNILRGNHSLDLYGPNGQSTAPANRRINDAA